MISASPTLKNILDTSTTINSNIGCTVEYNMNNLVDNISVSGTEYTKPDGSKPFKKLFPATSVIKPYRPVGAGIRYGIFGDVDSQTWKNPKNIDYQLNYRTYYAGSDTYYKYWLSPQGQGADITITYPQSILTNKIVVRFEISHSIPSTWTIYKEGNVQLATGNSSAIKTFTTGLNKNYDAGTLVLYYNGTGWTTTEPSTISAPVSISSLRLATSGVSGSYVGVIELSPRWISDLSSDLVNFSIAQESSTSAEDILPVGRVSANSVALNLVSYESSRKIISYTKNSAFDSSKIYLYKHGEIKPYFKFYYTGAPLTDSKGSYERINQGTFYIDSWTSSEYGDISISALDGAKILQEIIAPGIVCQDYSATAIIRRLLDGVGFTNYNFNYKILNGTTIDQSILSPRYWWSDDSKTVWNAIQEICRDSQMVATFDENNILQFYTRDYIFDASRNNSQPHWKFRYNQDSSDPLSIKLPNIIAFQKKDLATANQVKVLWNSVTSSEFPGNSQPLWKSSTTFMGAYSLNQDLSAIAGAGDWINLSAITVNQLTSQVIYSYTGYIVIDSEIIEYDAIEYQYLDKNQINQKIAVEKEADLQKIANDITNTLPANLAFGQTGKIRIKTRGCFGTSPVAHSAAGPGATAGWSGYDNILSPNNSASTITPSSSASNVAWSVATTPVLGTSNPDTVEASVKQVQKSLLQITCNSKNKDLYSMAVKNTNINTSGKYYTFGTGMFFQSSVKDTNAAGGLGFFTSNSGLNGYYVFMQTTSNTADSGADKALAIVKVVNGYIIPLTDSQINQNKTLNYVAGATSYKLDVRVLVEDNYVVIDAFINNFKITAVDTTVTGTSDPKKTIITPTSNISVFSSTGSSYFDYVYAVPLNKTQYDTGIMQNMYYGRFGSTTLNFLYGERLVSNFEKTNLPGGYVEEFGTVARELRKVDIKYDSRPGFPLYPSTGLSQYVQVLGSKLTSFGAQVYLINNAGTFMPLDDSRLSSFSIVGNYVVQAGQNEYMDSSINEFSNPEQVTFESTWIQTEADAKALSNWIKNQWSKKQSVCELTVFSNPLISVGDIVTINYPDNGVDETQKFMVVQTNNSFEGGINTSLTLRSIYS